MNPRNPKNWCKCGKKIFCRSDKWRACRTCLSKVKSIEFGLTKKISDFKHTNSRHRYQNVREHAHRMAIVYGFEKKCARCSYDKHVELCHIKAISSFSIDTLLSIVNSSDNIIFLCPNCHWEQENDAKG